MKKSLLSILLLISTCSVWATTVRFETTVGDIDIELYDQQAPITVENFLNYVNDGDYDDTVIHRSVPGFVIQGGGFRYSGSSNFQVVDEDSPITNESVISNTQATIAMARTTDPHSATNQWFINLTDNSALLDETSNDAGYAVFGHVTHGFDVAKIIESFLRVNFSSSNLGQVTSEFPIYGFFSGTTVTLDNVVKINKAYVLSDNFQINAGLSGAWFNPDTNGQGINFEVLPSANSLVMAWFTYDSEYPDSEVPSTVGDAGNRWLTVQGTFDDNVFVGDVYKSSGGLFDQSTAVSNTNIGEVMITFNDCTSGVMSYTLDDSGLSNTINIQRISGANVDLCEQLDKEAR